MIKKILGFAFALSCALGTMTIAQADYATTPQPFPNRPYPPAQPYPQPYPPQPYPQPYYPQPAPYPYPAPAPGNDPYCGPFVGPVTTYPGYPATCYAQGLANGAMFYGVGVNYYAAQQWALYACGSTGQYCRITGCQ